ncbi:hypothetical protein [Streptomyces anulatus]|uniref:hypothetical protein n=1 Tax=Streptomyces anulatus TaxID=1892 RepID=UPI00371BA1A0
MAAFVDDLRNGALTWYERASISGERRVLLQPAEGTAAAVGGKLLLETRRLVTELDST